MITFPYELDELIHEADEYAFESDESDESDEARRGRGGRRPPVRTARRGNAVPQRPASGFATKAELTATANRLDARIATNSNAVKTLEGRVNTVSSDTGKLRTDLNKVQGSLNDVRNMSMLMPLLSTQKTVTTTDAAGGIPVGSKVVVDSGDTFSKILPLLMFSGSFGGSSGGSGSSGGMFGGDSSGLMMVALIMATQGNK
ncbi:MAG TPA: hypothetical protein VGQ93_10695 [Lysobacter sp.]|jgi:hypothetical protein|nr:hypothetical protein [Lysobacter sp.]